MAIAAAFKDLGATLDDVLENEEMDQVLDNMPEEAGAYASTWLEKNQGEVFIKSKGAKKSEGKSFGGGKKAADGDSGEKKKSLLGK